MSEQSIGTMAFFSSNGLADAWNSASLFAGKNGRFATVPDVIDARIASDRRTFFWHRYVTTLSAEYYGLYNNEKPTLVVAHGVGPLTSLQAVEASFEERHESHRRGLGYITQKEFDDLVEGKYGHVTVIDFEAYLTRHNPVDWDDSVNQDNGFKSIDALLDDERFVAKVGGLERAKRYLARHREVCVEELKEEGAVPVERIDNARYFISRGRDGQACYSTMEFDRNRDRTIGIARPNMHLKDSGYAWGHLLSVDQLSWVSMRSQQIHQLTFDVSIHERGDGVRLVAANHSDVMDQKVPEYHYDKDVKALEPKLLVSVENPKAPKLVSLVTFGDHAFTELAKVGCSMDTHQPEHLVTSKKDIGEPIKIRIGENLFFLRYDVDEHVMPHKPDRANAFTRVEADAQGSWIEVQFHKIEADWSQRLLTREEVFGNPQLLVELARKQAA